MHCSAALLVRPCIDIFSGPGEPEVGQLILTFMALVFSAAFT